MFIVSLWFLFSFESFVVQFNRRTKPLGAAHQRATDVGPLAILLILAILLSRQAFFRSVSSGQQLDRVDDFDG